MKNAILFSMLILTTSCASYVETMYPKLLPKEQRQKEYLISHTLKKKMAFQKISIWTAKSFSNANEAIKLRDIEMGTLIAKGNVSCDTLDLGNGFASDKRLDLTLEITVDDNNAKIDVTDIIALGSSAWDSGYRPSTKEEMDKFTGACIDPLIDDIKAVLK